MTTKRLVALLLVAMAGTVILARARGAGPATSGIRTFHVTGIVSAPPADGRIMVAHGDIPGYMPAMTMPFTVGPSTPALAAGDRVRFTLRVASGWSRAEAFEVDGQDRAVADALKTSAATIPRLRKGDALPAASLVTQSGRPLTADDFRSHVTAMTFIFTRCPVPEFCPLMVKRFQQIQSQLASEPGLRQVRLISVTLDPGFDTPPVLEAYAKAMRADPERWLFVTGRPDEISRLTGAFAIHVERNGLLLDHTLATAVIDGDGRIAEIWRGNGWKAAEVLETLRRVATPAAD